MLMFLMIQSFDGDRQKQTMSQNIIFLLRYICNSLAIISTTITQENIQYRVTWVKSFLL